MVWDADVRCAGDHWTYHKIKVKAQWSPNPNWDPRTAWGPENNIETQKYMLNAYRVLLTRARQGLVICVPSGICNLTPEGYQEDSTRDPKYFDGTYNYLKSLGIEDLPL